MRIPTFVILLLLTAVAGAKNVDLSTVPNRDTVQLTIYNSEDLTLVRETRKVTFKKGSNPLQFSWANTLIDPTSLELKFLTSGDKLELLDTTYPQDKPQMLYWNVQSEIDGEATIQITYFTSGITWSADYQAIANKEETAVALEGFVRVYNNSGEDYKDAEVRLVVGTINLVEKISQLARLPMADVQRMAQNQAAQNEYARFRDQAAREAFGRGAAGPSDGKAKEIIKEGLSEYFIFTIEGTETVPHGWSKRMRSISADAVPVKIQYRYRPQEYGEQLVRMYLMTNNTESKLGSSPLPNGVVRLYRNNGRDGLSYLTAQTVKYIPIGDKVELNLGADPEVIFELIKLKTWRDNIWMRLHSTNVFRRVGDGGVQIEVDSSVEGWDDHQLYTQRIRNYTAKAIDVEIRRTFGGHVAFRSSLNPTLFNFNTVQFGTTVEPGKKADLYFEVLTHQGRNSKQSNVTLETWK